MRSSYSTGRVAGVWIVISPLVLGFAIAAAVLAIMIVMVASATGERMHKVSHLISTLCVVLGALTVVLLATAAVVPLGTNGVFGRLVGVCLAAAGLVSASMMLITASFRVLLEKYRRADTELSRVI